MRKLLWLSIGFGATCALGVYLLPVSLLLGAGFGLLTVSILLLLLRRRNWIRTVAVLLLGMAFGLLWFRCFDFARLMPARELDGQTVSITVTAEDYSYDTDYGIALDGKAILNGRAYRLRIYLNQQDSVAPGDRITGKFRLRYTAPGALEGATHHSGKGTLFLGYPKGKHTVVSAEKTSWRYMPAYLRQRVLSILDGIFPLDAAPFAKALLLGDTSEMDYETDTNLSISGLRHVAAVSGLHVSILFSVIYLFAGKRRILTAVIGIPVLFLFAAMAGFSASILRAGMMQLLMLLAMAFKREYDPPTALGFAALVMLVADPLTITSVGFQLSVASVAGIFLFSTGIKNWLMDEKRLGRWKKRKRVYLHLNRFASSVSISLSAMVLTTPLTAWYFGSVSLLSVVTNLLCLWMITYLFCGIIAACILAAIWLPLGRAAAWVLAWLVRYILAVSGAVAQFPLSAVYTESVYIAAWLVLCYLLLTVFLLSKEKRPVILCCCAVVSLCIALLASWTEPLLDTYRVTVLDVGQGQCVVLQSGGKTYVVDCGGSYGEDAADVAAGMLLSQGISHIDGLILTHYDKDHVGGAEYLLHRVKADVLILPEGKEAEAWDAGMLENHSGAVIRADRDRQILWGAASIRIFASFMTESSNESSLCVLFQTEKCDILITGDRSTVGEEALLMDAELPQLDALVVGHHGAASSTGEALLQATRPKQALISVGEGNAYNHPSEKVLERLAAWGCAVRRTDLEGTILIRG